MKTKLKNFIVAVVCLWATMAASAQPVTGPSPICPNQNYNYTWTGGSLPTGCVYENWNVSNTNIAIISSSSASVTIKAGDIGNNDFDLQYMRNCSTTISVAGGKNILVNGVGNVALVPSIGSWACQPGAVTFTVTASSPNANYYVWSVSGGGTIVTPTNGNTVTISKPASSCVQSITVSCTAKRSECSAYNGRSASVTVTSSVNLPTSIAGPDGLCATAPSNSSVYSVAVPPNSCYTYNWYFSPATSTISIANPFTSNPTLTVAPGAADGTKYLKCTITACGRSVTLSKNIKLCGAVTTPTDIAASQYGPSCYYKFTASGACATKWGWQINGGPIEFTTLPDYFLVDPGLYTVKVRSVNACGTSAWRTESFDLEPIVGNPPCQYKTTQGVGDPTEASGLDQPELTFTVYPNPSNGIHDVQVACSEALVGGNLEIYNVAGARVMKTKVTATSFDFSIDNLESGLYFCRIFNGKQLVVRKFVVSE